MCLFFQQERLGEGTQFSPCSVTTCGSNQLVSMHSIMVGDRILILKPKWLRLLLSGEKDLEIRGCRFKPGNYYLGCGGLIHASCQLGTAIPIQTPEDWDQLRPRHRVASSTLPYKNTWGLPVTDVVAETSPVR